MSIEPKNPYQGVCSAPRSGTVIVENVDQSMVEGVLRLQEFRNEHQVPLCTFRHSYTIALPLETRTVDETFTNASKQTDDRPLGRSPANCKHCDRRRLFLESVHEPIHSASPQPRASDARDYSYHHSFGSRHCSLHDHSIDDHHAPARARSADFDRATNYSAANDIGTPRPSHDDAHHNAGATYICSTTRTWQSLGEYASESEFPRRLLL
jgi:hypothetical protein